MRRIRRPVTVLLFAALCLISGCGRAVERKAEDAVNAILPEYVGPAEKYQTRVRGGTTAIVRGRLRSVHVEGTQVRLMPQLTADTLVLDLDDVEVDTKARTLRSVGAIAFVAELGETNLRRYVDAQNFDIRDLRVSLANGAVRVTARPVLLGIPTVPFTVSGRLVVRGADGFALDFQPSRANVSVVPVPGILLDYLSEKLNPLLDLSTLRLPIHVREAQIERNRLVLRGTVRPDDLLRAAQQAARP